MKSFEEYLSQYGEVGQVEQIFPSLTHVSGLPTIRPGELVLFEPGGIGQVMTLKPDRVEVLLFNKSVLEVGTRVVRTGEQFQVQVGMGVLGAIIDPLGEVVAGALQSKEGYESRPIDTLPPPLMQRQEIVEQFETGVVAVDLVVPLGKGQRQLVIGDRKVGKSAFLRQAMLSHAMRGGVCIYAGMAKRQQEISALYAFVEHYQLAKNTVGVVTGALQPAGLVFQTPYVAMTIAEYFRDQGMDVLLIMDDMTIHAKYYRELMLSAKRFPGRSAYPGDIFYVHARLMEPAGNFTKGSITVLPVAETVLGDISGYIQTNLMSMTDGHIYFDIELYNQGRRPAVSPFLSVTRVGHQAQTDLYRSLSRELSSFLSTLNQTEELLHFGGEIGEEAKKILALGAKVTVVFNQGEASVISQQIAAVVIGGLFGGLWEGVEQQAFQQQYLALAHRYAQDAAFRANVDQLIGKVKSFAELLAVTAQERVLLLGS